MKFTFSNWLNNEIPDSLLNVDTGLLPHFFIDHMTKPDWQLLYDYQRSAYQLLVEYIAAITTDSFLSDISGAPDVQTAVTHKINKLEKQFNSLSDEDQELILQGDFNAVGLTSKICKKIHEIARAYPIENFKDAYKRDNYLAHLFKEGNDQDVTWFFARCRVLNSTISGAIDYRTMLLLQQPESKLITNAHSLIRESADELSKGITNTGRPQEFDWKDTQKW